LSTRSDGFRKSLDRHAEPDETTDAVAFRADPPAKFMNGQVLRMDDGFSLFL
jgi:2-hydroxycyclohexanecarboxyl-CoA dehydrogenase